MKMSQLDSTVSCFKPKFFLMLLAATVIVVAIRIALNAPLISTTAPLGIVSLSFSGNQANAQTIVNSWRTGEQILAAFGLGWDFLGLILYSTTIAWTCYWFSSAFQHDQWLRRIGLLAAWAQFPAAVLNVIENCALLTMLLDWRMPGAEHVALGCALAKFFFVGCGLSYCLASVCRMSKRR